MGIYDQLGVPKVINGYDTMTYLGGSKMPDAVLQAMAEAREHFVDMRVLHAKIGEQLASLTRNEAALVTGGAAAAMVLATAACIAGDDPILAERMPDTSGLKDEIIIHRCQRNRYDQAIRLAGGKLVEVGYFDGTTRDQFRGGFSPNTAAVFYFCGTTFEEKALPLEQVIEIANEHNIPVIVNAAAQLPPADNLWRFTQLGAKLAIFSGGKGLRGPQGTGLIVGDKELVSQCASHSCPNYGIGRCLKTGREDIVGLYTAVKRFVNLDPEEELKRHDAIVALILKAVQSVPGVTGQRKFPARLGQTYPRAVITLEESFPVSRLKILSELQKGTPRIELGPYELDNNSLYVNPLPLTLSEAEIVAKRLQEILSSFAKVEEKNLENGQC